MRSFLNTEIIKCRSQMEFNEFSLLIAIFDKFSELSDIY